MVFSLAICNGLEYLFDHICDELGSIHIGAATKNCVNA